MIGGDLQWVRIDDDGAVKKGAVPVVSGMRAAVWSRTGMLALIDGDSLRVLSPEGKEIGVQNVTGADGEEAGPLAFIGENDKHLVVKSGELWRLFDVSSGALTELSRITETFEQERFGAVSADGKLWVATSSDTGGTLYDQDGKVIDQFPGTWQSRAAFAADGTLAICSINEAVVLRLPDGKRRNLAEDEDVIVRNTNGISLQWVGKRLYARSIHRVRSWDLRRKQEAGQELGPSVWDFAESDITDTLVVNQKWLAVSLASGAIVVSSAEDMGEVDRLLGHEGLVVAQAFPFEDCLASVGEDGTMRHWLLKARVRGGSTLGQIEDPIFKGHEDEWMKLEKSRDDIAPRAASPGRPLGTLVRVNAPDGQRSASTGEDGQLRIWKDTEALLALPGPARMGESLAFSKDGRRIGGEFMQPGEDWSYEQEWTTEPWTRKMLGIDEQVDWRKAYEAQLVSRFKEQWTKRLAPGK